MLDSIVSSKQLNVLETALSASALRHKVISNNIANVNTPGFKKSVVSFEEQLTQLIDGDENQQLSLLRTHERHLPIPVTKLGPVVNEITDTTLRVDGNNVDIDSEMADLAKNNIYYDALAQQISKYFTNLKSAITGGR